METILVVEDEEVVRELIREILEMHDYRIVEARNGLEAMSIFEKQENKIDLVITDVIMPTMSGVALGNLLSFSNLQNRIIYISGYVEDSIGDKDILEAGNFIEKPFLPETLVQKVRDVLDSN